MIYRAVCGFLAGIAGVAFAGCLFGWIFFCPPEGATGMAVDDLHKWVVGAIVSFVALLVFGEEAR